MLTTSFNLPRALLVVSLAMMLGACGLQQSVTDGTLAAFDALFYKQIKTLRLDFSAREGLNSDSHAHHPLSQPVMLRVFQLQDNQAFERAVYQQLTADAASVLGSELLAERDVALTPGGAVNFSMPMEKESRYVAVVALFQQPDRVRNSWRLLLARNDLEPDSPRVIELGSNSLRLLEKGKP